MPLIAGLLLKPQKFSTSGIHDANLAAHSQPKCFDLRGLSISDTRPQTTKFITPLTFWLLPSRILLFFS
jgi:hypothetical protein